MPVGLHGLLKNAHLLTLRGKPHRSTYFTTSLALLIYARI
jgi:hypothetical protein